MPDCLIVAILVLFILGVLFIAALCVGLACAAWIAFTERRMRARYHVDAARARAAIRRGSRITHHRMPLP